jgi:hypothetical protein
VSVCLFVIIVYDPFKVDLGGSVRTTEDPLGSVNVLVFNNDEDGANTTLVVDIDTG